MNKLQLDDFTKYHFLSGVRFAPDGSSAAFIDKIANVKDNGYDSCIRLVRFPEMTVTKLTTAEKESSFLYDDADTILFPANRSKADEPEKYHLKTVFYKISLSGGEATPAFSLPYQVTRMENIREDLYVFTAEVDLNRPDPENAPEYALDDFGDYHVLEELPYWANGAGFVSRIRETLYLYDAKADTCTALTEPFFNTSGFSFNEKQIVYFGSSYTELLNYKAGIYSYDLTTGETTTIVEPDTYEVRGVACDENGFWFLATDMARYGTSQSCDLRYYDGTEFHIVDDHMPSVGAMPTGDVSLGGGPAFLTRQGKLYYRALMRTKSDLFTWQDGAKELVNCDITVSAFDVNDQMAIFVGMYPGKLQEIFVKDLASGKITQVTDLNDEILHDKYIGECRYVGFTDSDGVEIDGWLVEPKDYDPSKKYPGILDMHGGPRVALGPYFFHEVQYWANEGYFVFYCNPRGGDGRGDEFADLREKWGTIDFADLMEFVDHVLEITPAIDPARLGVTGGSYGGWMTNWIIGHTTRFAAAASQRSFSNWLSDFGCSEIGFTFDVSEVGATPWQDPMKLWDRSPVKYVPQVTTPTLFIHSLQDYNCPFSEGMQMFAGLKYHHVPSRVCAFEGENHELSRSGKPRHRIRRLTEITAWMDKYCKQ